MQVQDIMAREVIQCGPNDSLAFAAQLMRDRNVGCVVIAEGGAALGILTDRDLAVRCLAEGRDPQTPVSECMSAPATIITPEADILEAAHLMAERRERRMPVQQDGQLVGLVSFSDISWALERPLHDILYGGAAAARHPMAA